jgi:hypothetical protein
MDAKESPVLNREAVAAILGVQAKTISQYLTESRPADPESGRAAGRYASHPFPAPDGYIGRGPWWRRERTTEIREWDAGRLGQGAGGGRPRGVETAR